MRGGIRGRSLTIPIIIVIICTMYYYHRTPAPSRRDTGVIGGHKTAVSYHSY